MTLRKIHKRASIGVAALNKRQATSSTTAAGSSVSHGIQMPTGPNTAAPQTSTSTRPVTTTTTTTPAAPTTTPTGTTNTALTTAPTTTTAPATTGVATTPPPTGNTRSTSSEATVTRSITSRVSSTSTRSSATATATSDDSDGMSLGTIAGAAAAVIIGIGVITAFTIWFIRRRKRNSDIDEEPFNRNSFLRQSTAIPDDDAPLPSRARPPPGPSMVERQPTPLYGAPNPYNDMGNDGFGYNTQPSYNAAPGQMYNGGFGPGGAPATPLPNTPGFGTTYDQGFNNGGYAELTRGNTPHDYPPSPHMYEQYNHHLESPAAPSFAGRDGFPSPPPTAHGAETVVPGQDAAYKSGPNYPELTPATATAQQGQVVTVKESAHDGRETPVQLGFAPAQAQPKPMTAAANKKQRPESSMYNEDDAYGGM